MIKPNQPVIGTGIQLIGDRRIVHRCSGTFEGDLPDPDFRFNMLFVEHDEDFPMHGHQYSELVIVLGGSALHRTSTENYPIGVGDVFVINGDMQHGFSHVRNLRMGILQYDPDPFLVGRHDLEQMMGFHALFDLEPRSRQNENFRSRLRLNAAELSEAELLLNEINREFHNRFEGWKTMVQAGFFQLVTRLSRSYTTQKKDTPSPMVRMAHVASHIRKHFRRNIRIEQLAKIACLSPSQFQRVFKRTYHATPGQFIHRLRIEHACQLLRDETRDIASIAEASGFSTPAFFSTQFRRTTGMTPSAYRRSLIQGIGQSEPPTVAGGAA